MNHARRGQASRLAWLSAFIAFVLAFGAWPGAAMAGSPTASGSVAGVVFFDADGTGVATGRPGVAAATVQLAGAGGTLTTTTDPSGAYAFAGLEAGNYTVTVQPPAGFVTTTVAARTVTVSGDPVTGINFGLAYPISLWGVLCQDLNNDGMCSLPIAEPRIAGATVQVFDDANRNGRVDLGEGLLAGATTDSRGLYLLANLSPGSRIVLVRLPGGAESSAEALSLESAEVGATSLEHNLAIGRAALEGVVFNDVNGDEFPDAGEAPVRGAVVQLLAAASGQAASPVTVVATATTGTDGRYVFSNVLAATYQVRVYSAPVPPGWLQSPDPSALIRILPAGVTTTLSIGFFDPASVSPMSVADWKRELRQVGQWAYAEAETTAFIESAQSASLVFSETVALRDALLLGGATGVPPEKWRALKEHAALWLNVVSDRLRLDTAIELDALTAATTVRQARDEIEALLRSGSTADHERAFAIARALNTAQGVGSGRTGTSAVVDALYRGVQVAGRLRPGGDLVDLKADGPLTLRKWSAGSYGVTTNALMPQVRIRVKSFNEGGVLDVIQVFPDGRRLKLGTLQSAVQNRDVNKTYQLSLSRVATLAEMVNATIVLTVRDVNGGKPASVKVDSAEIVFGY
ncbi:MAG: SdrD B-like domain-containing protein [Anaerolineae bacterium]